MRVTIVAVGCAVLLNCNGAIGLVIKPPVVSKCEESGLKGCDELTEGVLLYAEGNQAEGRLRLRAGIAKNSTTRVRRYAATLKTIVSLPGIDRYAGPIREVCDILADETGGPLQPDEESAAVAAEKAPVAKGEEPKGQETAKQHGLRTSTAFPAANGAAYSCKPFSAYTSEAETGAMCLQVSTGPLVITDIHVNAGCPYELFFAVGKLTKPRWFVVAPTGGTSLHSARLLVKNDEVVTVGARGAGDEGYLKLPECSLTWSAEEP